MPKMPLTAFVSRLRTGSQAFNKEQSSSNSSVSLQQERNGTIKQPSTLAATPQHEITSTDDIYASGARLESAEDSNTTLEEPKNDPPLTLRKKIFSRTGAKIPLPLRPMTSGNPSSMNDKVNMLRGPNGQIDMVALLQVIENMYSKHFHEANFEPVRQITRTFDVQKEQYQWLEPGSASPSYPPCLAVVPEEAKIGLFRMFDMTKLMDAAIAMTPEVPMGISTFMYGEPLPKTMAQLESRIERLTQQKKNIGSVPSIANRKDWYTDAVFAQQSFTGSNPTTITNATSEWVKRFMNSANTQGNKGMYTMLSIAPIESIYLEDNSHVRSAVHAASDSTLCSEDGKRFGCSAVTLFQLHNDGRLHPLAIVLDYRGNMENSVCIFNRRLDPNDNIDYETSDWPWRYAKLCAQVSDWMRHECAVHLNDCHFVQEATIVAAQRSFPTDHVVYNLLAPHWSRTLSLNALARETIIPDCVTKMTGMTVAQTYSFILDAYKRFNFPANYIPNSLSRRGFTPRVLSDGASRNYVWAKNMSQLWSTLYKFIYSMLSTVYRTDDDVSEDKSVQSWCAEMHSQTGGQMSSFPDIRTLDDLINAICMCIHTATSQHNSVNDLQCYYMSFVPNKPSCLMSPLPTKLSELMRYQEKDFVAALPLRDPHVWRMCEQLPYLLSEQRDEGKNMVEYAKELERDARSKHGSRWEMVGIAAREFHDDLLGLERMFERNNAMMDDKTMPYMVLHPTELSVSITM